jgi:hypothetical protein
MSSYTHPPYIAPDGTKYPSRSKREYTGDLFEMREMIEAGMFGWPGPKNNGDLLYSLAFTAEAHSWAIENVKSNEEMDRLSKI